MSSIETNETTETPDTAESAGSTETPPEPAKRKSRLWKLTLVMLCLLVVAWTQRERLASLPNSMARRAMAQHNEQDVLKWLRIAERISARNAESEFLWGRLRRRQGRLDDAERHLKRAEYLGYDEELLRRERWLAAAQSGQMSVVERHLAALLQDPMGDGQEICEAYVIGYLRLRRFAPAMELIEAWMEGYPQDPQPCFWAGQVHQDLHSIIEADRYFRQAPDKAPSHAPAALGLGQVLMAAKRAEDAVQYFRIAQQDGRFRTDAMLGLARCLRAAGEIDEATETLDALLQGEPTHSEALVEKANIEIELGNYDDAEMLLRPALQRDEKSRELRFAYGTALRGMGRSDEAQAHFDYATQARAKIMLANDLSAKVAERPQDAQLRYEVGKLYLEYGSSQEGLMWLHSVLECDPAHAAALQALANYYGKRAEGDPKFLRLAQKYQALATPHPTAASQSEESDADSGPTP